MFVCVLFILLLYSLWVIKIFSRVTEKMGYEFALETLEINVLSWKKCMFSLSLSLGNAMDNLS